MSAMVRGNGDRDIRGQGVFGSPGASWKIGCGVYAGVDYRTAVEDYIRRSGGGTKGVLSAGVCGRSVDAVGVGEVVSTGSVGAACLLGCGGGGVSGRSVGVDGCSVGVGTDGGSFCSLEGGNGDAGGIVGESQGHRAVGVFDAVGSGCLASEGGSVECGGTVVDEEGVEREDVGCVGRVVECDSGQGTEATAGVRVVKGEDGSGDEKVVVVETSQVGVVGESKLERNQRWRKERKETKLARQARGFDSRSWRKPAVPSELSESWVARKNAENKLATLKAEKDLAYQQARDVEAESRKRRAALMKSTERDKVAVEKAFSTLKATGNVPGFCSTVVDGSEVPSLSGGSGSPHDSISPDSSASMHEFREVQKKNLDLEAEVAKLKREMKLNMVRYGEGATYSLNEAYTVTPSLREEFKKMEDEDHYVDEIPDPESDYRVTVRRVFVVPEFPDMWT